MNKSSRFRAVALLLVFITTAFANPNDKKPVKINEINTGTLLQKGDEPGNFYELPRLDTNVKLKIDGIVVSATVDQMFLNNSNKPIEAVYVFPLPDKAAVYDMQMQVNDRFIQSVVKERKEAKKAYERAKSEGKRASLTEQERPNVFTNSVANILPGDTIVVRLRFVDYLEYSSGEFKLRFPMVVGPRYIPGEHAVDFSGNGWSFDTEEVLDGSRITPPVRKKTGNTISLKVDLNAGFALGKVWSPTHSLNINNRGTGLRTITFDKKKEVPNRDFVLSFSLLNPDKPNSALFTSKVGNDKYFMSMTIPPVEGSYTPLPKEVIYILDISGSMEGESIRQAKQAISQAIRGLGSEDYFNVIIFNDYYSPFFEKPMAATQKMKNKAFEYIIRIEANGGTEALPALLFGMKQIGVSNAFPMIFFITDGVVGNEEAIIRNVNYSIGDTRLFSIGIGSAPNSYLLRKISKYGRGSFTYINSVEDVDQKIETLLKKIDLPVLSDLQFSYGGAHDLYPNPIQDLYHDEPLILFGKVHYSSSMEHATLKGNMSDGPVEFPLTLDWSHANTSPAIPTLWARSKITGLMDEYQLGDNSKRKEIIDLAVDHHILTKFTSFLAIENRVVNPMSELISLAIPTDLPHGWDYDAVFGPPSGGVLPVTYASRSGGGGPYASMPKPASYKPGASTSSDPQTFATISLPQTGTKFPLFILIGFTFITVGVIVIFLLKRT